MAHQAHAYHMVDPSPWPLTGAVGALLITSGLAIWFHFHSTTLITLGLILLLLTIFQWWRDIIREGTFQGHHTPPVQKGLRYGIILFITSEVFFFLGFFWAFYHSSLAPTPELGGCWPPTGITTLDPFEVPLLNTTVLLASGVTVTWAHHSIIEGERKQAIQSLGLTILLGLYFTALQAIEYYEAPFTIADGVYGSTFFVATGFHGLHVIIGSTFLAVCLLRQIQYHFTSEHHFGFEAAAWYWHFVDVVWLFLYVSIYWWGSYLSSIKLVQVTSNHLALVKPQGKIMNLITTIIIIALTLSSVLAVVSFWLPQINPDAEKLSPYECGFDPLGSARLPFSLRFFLVAILFLLFDLEIALLLPLPWGDQLNNPAGTFFWATSVLILLTLGLIYEWTQGGLEWAE